MLLTASALVGLVLLAAACGAPAAVTPATDAEVAAADAVVVAEDHRFVNPPTRLGAGELSVVLDNRGRSRHDLTVEGEAGAIVVARGGERAVGDVTLPPGTHTVFCSVGGHRRAGMEFEVVVE